jgi:hypothetical protein
LQITVNSYIANLAAVFAASDFAYFGPQTEADLLHTTVCMPQLSQSIVDSALQRPLGWENGQQLGKRLMATNKVRVGSVVAPNISSSGSEVSLDTMMAECKRMLINTAAQPQGGRMAIIVPTSQARDFLAEDNCDQFSVAGALRFSQIERMPHFIMPYDTVRAHALPLQTWNAVVKYMSATEEYRHLEKKYLRADFTCNTQASSASAITLQQQSGAASCSIFFAADLPAARLPRASICCPREGSGLCSL